MTEYGKRVAKKMEDYMGNPDSASKEINDIQHADEGVKVRGALAAGVAKSFNKSKDAEHRSIEQTDRVDRLIRENPQPSEVVDARGNHNLLGERLNATDAQLADKANKGEVNSLATGKADKSYVENEFRKIHRELNTDSIRLGNVVIHHNSDLDSLDFVWR